MTVRPYIICHMTVSLDGKVTGDFLGEPACAAATDVYYEINRRYAADAFACGRVTMEGSFTGGFQPDLTPFVKTEVPAGDYIAQKEAAFFAVAFDRKGRLGWTGSEIVDEDPGYGGAHIVEVVTEAAPKAYLAYLRGIGVSYIIAGEEELDLPLALEKLHDLFGIKTLLLEGGSILNGAFQREGVIDELSLVVAPITAQSGDKPLFMESINETYVLSRAEPYENSVLWLNYQKTEESSL